MVLSISSVALLFALSASTLNHTDSILRQKDQALLDAVAPGDRASWGRMTTADFVYVDENDRIIPKSAFLKELTPMVGGVSGNLAISSYEVHRDGATAIVVHLDNETEHYFGTELHAQFLMTETWQLYGTEWKLRVVHCASVPVDAPTITLTSGQMDELTGTYAAGTLTYVVRRDGDRLLGARPGKPESELKAETRDVLIIHGQPRSRKVFSRDAAGRVTGFADRRENRDLVWSRVSANS